MNTQGYRVNFLKELFNLDKDGNKTTTSLYYQHILLYLLEDVNQFYKVRQILNGIITKVPIRRKGKTKQKENPSDIVENREKTFRIYCDNLKFWNLVSSRETVSEKGKAPTNEYRLTKFGNLIALIISTEFAEDKREIYDKLYDYLESHFKDKSYSLDEFCIKYFRKCKEVNLFGEFIDYLRNSLVYNNDYISNDNDLFTHMILLRTDDKRINRKLWKLWKKSFNELSVENMRYIQQHLKLALERRIEEKIKDYSEFENARFCNMQNFGKITLEVYCAKCNDETNYFYEPILILIYLEFLFTNRKNVSSSAFKDIKCIKCKRNKFNFSMV
jgi:hypothetical protein